MQTYTTKYGVLDCIRIIKQKKMENKKRIDARKNNKGHKGLCGRPKKFQIEFGKTKRISVSIPSLKENEIKQDINIILNKYM